MVGSVCFVFYIIILFVCFSVCCSFFFYLPQSRCNWQTRERWLQRGRR